MIPGTIQAAVERRKAERRTFKRTLTWKSDERLHERRVTPSIGWSGAEKAVRPSTIDLPDVTLHLSNAERGVLLRALWRHERDCYMHGEDVKARALIEKIEAQR